MKKDNSQLTNQESIKFTDKEILFSSTIGFIIALVLSLPTFEATGNLVESLHTDQTIELILHVLVAAGAVTIEYAVPTILTMNFIANRKTSKK